MVRPQCGQAIAVIDTLPPQSGQRYRFGELLLERFCDRITNLTTAMTMKMGAASATAKMRISVKPSPNILCSSHESHVRGTSNSQAHAPVNEDFIVVHLAGQMGCAHPYSGMVQLVAMAGSGLRPHCGWEACGLGQTLGCWLGRSRSSIPSGSSNVHSGWQVWKSVLWTTHTCP